MLTVRKMKNHWSLVTMLWRMKASDGLVYDHEKSWFVKGKF